MAKRSGSSLDGSLPATKRTSLHDDLAACPPLSLTRLAQAGQRNYDEKLQFDVVSTDKPSRLLVVGCKTFHWHPPAGFLSRTRVIVHEDRSYFFQVLLRSQQSGEIQTEDQLTYVSTCSMKGINCSAGKYICPLSLYSKYFGKCCLSVA